MARECRVWGVSWLVGWLEGFIQYGAPNDPFALCQLLSGHGPIEENTQMTFTLVHV